jgi:membrane-bound lytic murein transglycosylase D
MKAKAILLASVMLAGCQASRQDVKVPEQHAQSVSSASLNDTESGRAASAQWLSNDNSIAQQNLWSFIGGELKMEVPDNYRIREQKNKYLQNKSYLHDVTLRAEPYMYWIVEQIKQRKMPMELVLLPIVESAFDPTATSHARAAGLWQITPDTGRNYGLQQDKWYDGRRDVIASTTAALDMMQRLNQMFDGDWLLTIAAYNSGEGRVLQAVKTNKAKGRPTDFWALALPRETSVYVPKMLALSDLLKHSKKYGLRLPQPNESRALARVEVGQQVQLAQVAEMAGMSVSKLKTYNSGYKRDITAPNGPHYIVLPKEHAEQLKGSLSDNANTSSNSVVTEKLASSESSNYKVRSGETLSNIATRLGVTTAELANWNNVLTFSVLRAGQTLQVAKSQTTSTTSTTSNRIVYQVRKGDSLSSIAKRHGVNIKDLIRWNSGVDTLQPGEKLTLHIRRSAPDT